MRRYRKSTGKESMRASRTRPNLSLIQMQNAGTAMGMMAASGVRQGSLVQRAQRQTSGQKPRFTSGQARNAGVAMGMMAVTGQRSFRNQAGGDHIGSDTGGCAIPSAMNYSPNTIESGSCMWYDSNISGETLGDSIVGAGIGHCDDWSSSGGYVDYETLGDSIGVGQCQYVNYGCTDTSADNYNPSADQDWTLGGSTQTLCQYGGSLGQLTRASRAGVRQGSLVQRAQRQTSGQRPRFSSGQARNAGVAMGMMAASGRTQWSDDSFFRGASGESSPCNCKTTQTLSDGTVLTFFGKKLCGDRCCGQCKGAFELAPVQTGKRR